MAKALTLRVGEDAIIVVTCGDSRLGNRKVKEELGGKGDMMPGSETGNLVYLSGRLAKKDGKPWSGKLGEHITTEEGKQAARASPWSCLPHCKPPLEI